MIRFFSKTNMPKILSQKEKKFKNVEFLQYNHLEKFFLSVLIILTTVQTFFRMWFSN